MPESDFDLDQIQEFRLQRIREQLAPTERDEVAAWLESCGLAECFMP